ncbi:ATP-binding protein [Polaromonas sp.]|uniref:ATP-binding protein n=1 Tax=Polaromonas sp. TaxID=1869339 RepID=UPI00286BDB10|nr:ATP-binding protein [Polaromonas sp.]
MNPKRISSIRTRLAWLVAACLVPAFLMAAALVYAYYQNEQSRIVRESSASVLALSFAVDRELVSVETALLALASSPNLTSRNLAAFDLQARGIVQDQRIASVVLADLNGQQLINTLRPAGATLPRVGDLGLLQNVVATMKPVISDLFVGAVLRGPLISVGVPVKQDGKLLYVLIGGIVPTRFAEILAQQQLPADRLVAVLDRKGTVVAQNQALNSAVGQQAPKPLLDRLKQSNQGRLETITPQGLAALLVFNRSSYSGWTVSKMVPYQGLTSDLWRTAGWLMAALTLLLGGSLLLAWVMGGRIIRPLGKLSSAAQQLEAGLPAEIDAVDNSYAEVRTLSASFNALIRKLLQKEADLMELNVTLERRVVQRTVQLTKALDSMRENENRIKTIVETAQGAFIGVDFEGRITDWNTQAQKMLGWSREEILGQSLSVLVPERFRDGIAKAMHVFSSTGAAGFVNTNLERLVLTRDGRELAVEIRIGLINTGKLKFFSAFLYDISERKQVERMKSEFISTASHELRTPLTAIYASLDMLQSGMAGELPPDARELLGISHKSAERLVRLVNDVLDVEKIASRSMGYHKVPQALLPLVEQAITATQGYADQYRVQFELSAASTDAVVSVDADRIIQVIVNLLSNAAKFSPAGGAVVHVHLRQLAGFVRVSVIDTGSGIPEVFRGRIFQRFAQVDASDRRQKGGTGLGLNICKSIIEAHQGRIDFVSEAGKGCEFYFELPLAPSA